MEISKYGAPDELVDPAAPKPAEGGGLNEAVRLNIFKAWREEGEEEWLTEPETTGSTGRFQLLTKLQGMLLIDEDLEDDEHRIIVDLEWRTKKPTGWKGKRGSWKQWNAVTELDPKHHAEEITSKGGVENTRESYLIDEDLYDMIIAVPEAEQPRKVEEKPDEPMDEED